MGKAADVVRPYALVVGTAVAHSRDHGAKAPVGIKRRRAFSHP
jgi:hypothetical protein